MSAGLTVCGLAMAMLLTHDAASQSVSKPPERKFASDSMWKRVWVQGSDKTSGMFAEPRQIITRGKTAVVLDDGTREVRSFDIETGTPRITMSARGTGPGEFRRPALLTATSDGFAVLDHASSRLTAFSLNGKLVWDFVVPDVFEVSGICIPDGRTVIVHLNREKSNIVHYDTAGRRLAVQSVAWRLRPQHNVAFGYTARMSNPLTGKGCALAPLFGAEWALLNALDSGNSRAFPYIERGENPVFKVSERMLDLTISKVIVEQSQTTETNTAAQAVTAIGDTVIVYSRTQDKTRRPLLDYYHLPTGRYVYSRRLPLLPNGIAIAQDGSFIVGHIAEDNQMVIAMRPASLPSKARQLGRARRSATPPRPNTLARPSAPARVPPPASR